jgi:uncharacterized LabA/DUF88 family protein
MENSIPQYSPQRKLAVLIDADNAQPSIIKGLLEEIAKYGVASVKRVYGDWTTSNLTGWKDVLLEYAIQPIHQFAYTKGKNSTDSAMIIDAMDLLYTQKFEGFCLVSSDSDFTRLASRAREAGLFVLGFGEQKTPEPFMRACDKFIYTEILRESKSTTQALDESSPSVKPIKDIMELKGDPRFVQLLRTAVEDSSGEDGWANLANVGQNITNKVPDFDSRNYGFKKLGDLFKATDLFKIDERELPNSPAKALFVRDKRLKK